MGTHNNTRPILFSLFNADKIAHSLIQTCKLEKGVFTLRQFPDKETYLRILTDVKNRDIIILADLHNPDHKILSLIFFSETLKELGAKCIYLVSPYLPYMRQDTRFNSGEAITSHVFAKLISKHVDFLITIDPHLHRYKSLNEIYSIPQQTLHATTAIAAWIKENVKDPVIIGPDIESTQWVEAIAKDAGASFWIFEKKRSGDKDVEILSSPLPYASTHTPVLVDDIISTGNTLIETIKKLKALGFAPPVCIGIHALFAEDAYERLSKLDVQLITCNTIPHFTNAIDVSGSIAEVVHRVF